MAPRRAVAAVGSLVLSLVVVPTSLATAADPPGAVQVAVVAASGVGPATLSAFSTPDGPRTAYGPATAPYEPFALAASSDGSRTVSSEARPSSERLVVRDLGGAVVRAQELLPDTPFNGAGLSADGNRVAYLAGRLPDTLLLNVQDVATGSTRSLPLGTGLAAVAPPVFHGDDLVLLQDAPTATGVPRLRAVSVSGRTLWQVHGLAPTATSSVSDLVLSPDLTRAAFVRRTATGSTLVVASIEIAQSADLPPPGVPNSGIVTFGTPTTLATGEQITSPQLTRDGATVVYSQGGELFSVPVSGGTPEAYGPATPLEAERALAIGVREPTPPVVPTSVGPAVLNGTSVVIPFALAPDPTLSLLRVTRTSPGLPTVTRDVLLPRTSFTDTGLVVGATYAYDVQPVDRSGNTGPSRALSLVATAPPSLAAPDPTTDASAVLAFPVQVAPAGNAGDTRYSVDVREARAWARWVTLRPEATQVFGTRASAGVSATTSRPGFTYELRGQAVDRFGNATAPTRTAGAVVPRDQQEATLLGSTLTVAREGAYGGTSLFLRSAGASATRGLNGDRIGVIGERCPTCGEVDVFLRGVRVARVDTYAPTRRMRQVLWSRGFYTGQPRLLSLVAVGTHGRPTVVVDGFVNRRPFPVPGTGLKALEQLRTGEQLTSPNGAFRALLQPDGNLVLYDVASGRAIWATGTRTGVALRVQIDGNLVLVDAAGRGVFQSATRSFYTGTTLVLQSDGNLVLYADIDGKALWTSRAGRLRRSP